MSLKDIRKTASGANRRATDVSGILSGRPRNRSSFIDVQKVFFFLSPSSSFICRRFFFFSSSRPSPSCPYLLLLLISSLPVLSFYSSSPHLVPPRLVLLFFFSSSRPSPSCPSLPSLRSTACLPWRWIFVSCSPRSANSRKNSPSALQTLQKISPIQVLCCYSSSSLLSFLGSLLLFFF